MEKDAALQPNFYVCWSDEGARPRHTTRPCYSRPLSVQVPLRSSRGSITQLCGWVSPFLAVPFFLFFLFFFFPFPSLVLIVFICNFHRRNEMPV